MSDRSRLRLVVLRALVLAAVVTMIGRLWDLQVQHGASYRQQALGNGVRDLVTPAVRGQILDDMGQVLAGDRDALVVTVNRATLATEPDGGRAVIRRLAGVLHLSVRHLNDALTPCAGRHPVAGCWAGSPYQPVPVSDTESTPTALRILQDNARYPGVSVQVQSVRDYPQLAHGVKASHVLGFLGPITAQELSALPPAQRATRLNDLVGRSGLELQYNSYLEGSDGIHEVAVNNLGQVTGTVKNIPAVPGDTLVTSLNAGVQGALEQALVKAVATARAAGRAGGGGPADTAAGVVMDARTGRVLAMASYPTYNPNVFVGGISSRAYAALVDNPAHPLDNYPVMGVYPPGSTMKLITSSAILASGEAKPGVPYSCPPDVVFDGHTFGNFEGEALAGATLRDALIISCDSFFYRFGVQEYQSDQALVARGKRPREVVAHMAMDYGYGKPPHIDLPGAATGVLYDRAMVDKVGHYYWRQECLGAHDRHHSAARRARDAAACRAGPVVFEPGDQLLLNIGQGAGVAISPLEEAVAYCALVNGGRVFEPKIGAALVGPTGRLVRRIRPTLRDHLPVPQADLNYIESAMYGVTQSASPRGTAYGTFSGFPFNKVDVGGKTGTADTAGELAPQAWFASFAGPAGKKPDLVSVITVHNGGQGGIAAAAGTRLLWDRVFGLEGHRAIFPTGYPPAGLPRFRRDGSVAPPPAAVRPAVHRRHRHSRASGTTGTGGLGLLPATPPEGRRRGRGTGPLPLAAGGLP